MDLKQVSPYYGCSNQIIVPFSLGAKEKRKADSVAQAAGSVFELFGPHPRLDLGIEGVEKIFRELDKENRITDQFPHLAVKVSQDDDLKERIRCLLLGLEREDLTFSKTRYFDALTEIAKTCSPELVNYLAQMFELNWIPYEKISSVSAIDSAQEFFKAIFLRKIKYDPKCLQFLCATVGDFPFQTVGLEQTIRNLISPILSSSFLVKMMHLVVSKNKAAPNPLAALTMGCLLTAINPSTLGSEFEKKKTWNEITDLYWKATTLFKCPIIAGPFLSKYVSFYKGVNYDFSMVLNILESDDSAGAYFFICRHPPLGFLEQCFDLGMTRYKEKDGGASEVLLKNLLMLMKVYLVKSSASESAKLCFSNNFFFSLVSCVKDKQMLLEFLRECTTFSFYFQNQNFSESVRYYSKRLIKERK